MDDFQKNAFAYPIYQWVIIDYNNDHMKWRLNCHKDYVFINWPSHDSPGHLHLEPFERMLSFYPIITGRQDREV